MMKFAVSSAIAALALAIPAAAPAQKIGPAVIIVVDREQIYSDCVACKAAQTQLQAQLQQIQQRAQQLGQPIDAEVNAIRTAAGGKAPDAALQKRIQELQTKQAAAQKELAESEATFNRNRAFVSKQINDKLDPIITQMMRDRGASIALDQNVTIAISPAVNVTNDVLAALNQQLPSVSTTAPAAPAQQQPQGR